MAQASPRPTRHQASVIDAACRELLPEYLKWDRETDETDALAMLIKCHATDGYEFARNLENRCYVDPDAELVEILDGYVFMEGNAHRKMVREWVAANDVKPHFAVGDRFAHPRYGAGYVSSIRDDEGDFTFVPDSEAEKFANGGGYLLPFHEFPSIGEAA